MPEARQRLGSIIVTCRENHHVHNNKDTDRGCPSIFSSFLSPFHEQAKKMIELVANISVDGPY
jgi:hypothetical protein